MQTKLVVEQRLEEHRSMVKEEQLEMVAFILLMMVVL
jgi:hypothetical protein